VTTPALQLAAQTTPAARVPACATRAGSSSLPAKRRPARVPAWKHRRFKLVCPGNRPAGSSRRALQFGVWQYRRLKLGARHTGVRAGRAAPFRLVWKHRRFKLGAWQRLAGRPAPEDDHPQRLAPPAREAPRALSGHRRIEPAAQRRAALVPLLAATAPALGAVEERPPPAWSLPPVRDTASKVPISSAPGYTVEGHYPYGPLTAQRLDIIYPTSAGPKGTQVLAHG